MQSKRYRSRAATVSDRPAPVTLDQAPSLASRQAIPPPALRPAAEPPIAAPPAPPPPPARTHWTPAKQRIFLAALLDSGSIAQAARAARMSRSSAHRLRTRLAGTPFTQAWDRVLAEHARRLADPFAAEPLPAPRATGARATPPAPQ